ncbi:LLM class flavin-dependent oxidoreductase [Ochrobactrum sp. MYb15]|uniref:LLM class flavin-dependent oxidoreductase n=1 Tax=Brucella pituitosa TaxID=571256 RepID=UPI000CFD6907|nr:LLM class flavin-dependent oxidoreductase [Ochrobactrum sp. MYb19]PRA68536.1 LLM class flavin-dependent oxidoreductase [Ochrobactrum sp. MYb18]PRA74236.1 LLM class flavin-dependent oxidoreductase [Brucella thiophenivorans]PRA90788.1 LLM class flavin-dependent oxidoreductase [Ochrobactrum sp. MYb14]PRA96239.1 LLM class flavin-dependent oxidoreductase [Ochrobactrum sp. MYb15]
MRPVSLHTGAWRYPGAYADANFNFKHLKAFAQKLEAAKFDAFFMADHLAVLNMPVEALKRSHTVTSFEPFTLLSALAAVTDKIGLAATASTTFDEPYHIARRFASLDHISQGRAAWNIVTTSNPDSALNFGKDEHVEHGERYKRAREFYDVVTGLWDSFADDAFIRDQESGIFFDPSKMHVLDHHGDDFNVRGPLNIARPVQGWPVIVQAGQSEPGRQLAAETAEVVFCAPRDIVESKKLYADLKSRLAAAGRAPSSLKILPAAFIVLGDSLEEAKQKRAKLDSLVHYDSGIASLSIALGHDVSGFDPDDYLPQIPETNASKSGRAQVLKLAEEERLTVRQLAQRYGGYSGLAFVGTVESVADEMQKWLEEDASDGFTIVFPFLPEGLDDVAERLVPELQRRGIFRTDYEGSTLREHLGLPRPSNRFFDGS